MPRRRWSGLRSTVSGPRDRPTRMSRTIREDGDMMPGARRADGATPRFDQMRMRAAQSADPESARFGGLRSAAGCPVRGCTDEARAKPGDGRPRERRTGRRPARSRTEPRGATGGNRKVFSHQGRARQTIMRGTDPVRADQRRVRSDCHESRRASRGFRARGAGGESGAFRRAAKAVRSPPTATMSGTSAFWTSGVMSVRQSKGGGCAVRAS